MKHGHCALMGGISIRYNDYIRQWTENDLQTSDEQLQLKLRDISEDEIRDRNKADGLAQIVTCVQITWFTLQIVARTMKGYDISVLELSTAMYVICTIITYFFYHE